MSVPDSPKALRYVNKRMVVVINKMCVSITGGLTHSGTGLRDGASLGFVEWIHTNEVFGQPLFPDIFHQAAAYMFYVVKNHLFLDGNKRTGLACAVTFLQWNGVVFAPFDEDEVFDFIISVAAGPNDPDEAIPQIAAWFSGMSLH